MKKSFLCLISSLVIALCGCHSFSGSTSTSSGNPSISEIPSSSISSSSSQSSTSLEPGWKKINDNNEAAQDIKAQALVMSGKTDYTVLYRLKGYVQYPRETSEGHLEFADDTGVILIYGLSKRSTAIRFNGNTYSYAKTYTFNDLGLEVGDEVEIEAIYERYELSGGSFYPEIFGYVTKVKSNNQGKITAKSYTASETYTGTYYDSIPKTQTGKQLMSSLNTLLANTHTTWNSYNNLASAWSGCGIRNNDFYTNQNITSINREHVWPKSKTNGLCDGAGSDVDGDFLYLRPTQSAINEKRGAGMFAPSFGDGYYFVKAFTNEKFYYGTRSGDGVVNPAPSRRGDIARTLAYIYISYSNTVGTACKYSATLSFTDVLGPSTESECFNLLRKWNAEDPVDSYEIDINNYAETYQGNRNPFIDHPTYMDKCFA